MALRLSAVMASVAGLGADGAELEPLHMLEGDRPSKKSENPSGSGVGAPALLAVAVMQGRGSWVIKYVFDDEPSADGSISRAFYGIKQVTIATREGIVLVRGRVDVQPRSAN